MHAAVLVVCLLMVRHYSGIYAEILERIFGYTSRSIRVLRFRVLGFGFGFRVFSGLGI